MNRIEGQWALVTGASAGIGTACARRLADAGVNLVLWARRLERLEALAAELKSRGVQVRAAAVDVRDRQAVLDAVATLADADVAVDILVNNAGLASGLDPLQQGDAEDWDLMIDTNVKGLLNVSRAVLPGMVARNRGHVVNIGSTAGRWVYPGGAVYNATKFAVHALNEGMGLDLIDTEIRVSAVNPGLVETEFSRVRFHGDEARAATVYQGYKPLEPEDIADAVLYVLNTPPHVNVMEMYVLPSAQRNGVTTRKNLA